MIKKIIGTSLTILGCALVAVFISQGLLFPHILGPSTLLIVGVILLFLKRKNQGNRIQQK